MNSREMQDICSTLTKLVTPEMSPKQLMNAARKAHPKASKKAIARAAFYSLIANADHQDSDKSKKLQAFAISERTQSD
ncbi:hypothetical protein [Mesorhizobium sp. AA22]|uniref:hypothetical protein n=1 Tax=Mesorhizobium sp. AA22 TaxID=1854057 RepID=UPI0007EC593A|nr:hypothetical protein [Mesorhizobium sp. AA22]QIA23267.1 hypothetical protein A9K68_016930 [Mesorhizobium sp. AA22]